MLRAWLHESALNPRSNPGGWLSELSMPADAGRESVPRRSVAFLAIDGPNEQLFTEMLADGDLPTLRRMSEEGLSGTITHTKQFRNERCWSLFLAGSDTPETGAEFDSRTYDYRNVFPGERGPPPFYAGLGPDFRVCVFDLVAPLVPGLNGVQITGWGSELNAFSPGSLPPGLMDEMIARHGADPKMETSYSVTRADGTVAGMGFRNPSIYSAADLGSYIRYVSQAVERRTAIALDLIARGPWDLMLGMFPETHTANHLFWHLGRDYPVSPPLALTTDPLRELYRSVDAAIGRIAQALPDDCMLMVATVDETGPNRMDVPSMALLPEILWRMEGPGEPALFDPSIAPPPPPRRQDYCAHWTQDVWAARSDAGERLLLSPADLLARGDPIYWNPAWWYSALWPRMGAFALPSVSDGHIRLNVAGREAHGIVAPEQFGEKVAQVAGMVEQLTDARTGRPAVEECLLMRTGPDDAPHIPPDIVVIWSEHAVMDCLDHPELGRVGPVPHFRSGGHRAHGTTICNRYIASGGAISDRAASAADGSLLDLPATILDLIGAPRSPGMAGYPLIALAPADAPAP